MQLTMLKNKNRYFWLLLALLIIIPAVNIYADGSKDLYPNGASGRRAYLTSYNTSYSGSLPFQSYGTHYVYAKANETIALASSAWTGDATIKLFQPNGNEITTLDRTNNAGRISTRAQELAGPKLISTDNTANRYLPIYYTVPAGGEGIYKVEFWSKTTTEMISTNGLVSTMANEQWNDWNGSRDGKSTHIGAWDVSVINTAKTGYIKGRVYANLLNMRIEGSSSASQGFYGKMYVLTKDGYTYRVDNNGNNGILFAFFVNNNGFVKGKQSNGSIDYTPLYKSLKTVDEAVNDNKIWDPTGPDNEQNITHKMFYTLPSEDLPKDTPVNGAVPGGSTWLRNTVVVPRVMDVRIQGADNTEGQVSTKGGYIKFNTESQGAYTIKIESNGTPSFATRYLYGTAVAGENSVYWDGKDGNLTPIPAGTAPASITVQLQGAEVHFPYFDMENNINGIKLELLDHELLPSQEVVKSDIVYWNDTDIPSASNGVASNPKNNSHLPSSLGGVGSSGISSNSNGHKWGGGGTTGTFGDVKSMDTWTFIKGEEETIDTNVAIKIADLEVASVTTDKDNIAIGEVVEYTVTVKNNGPSDVEEAPFTFRLPPGFEPNGDPIFSGSADCTESIEIEYDAATRTYSSKLNLENGCEITYTFKATVTGSSDPDNTVAVAGILRPNDVTDPNATNSSDPSKPVYTLSSGRTWDNLWKYPGEWPDADDVENFYIPPFSAEFECSHSGSADPCNNIGSATVNISTNSTFAVDDFVETDQNESVSGNVLTNDYDPEGHTQTVSNTGTYTTEEGGSITINANGSYTYTPPTNFSGLDQFEYRVCDNGTPQACDNAILLIGVGICAEEIDGEVFSWSQNGGSSPVTKTITQPGTNYGFVFDIYELDNSFNMEINGTKIAVNELEFQSNGTPGLNVRFADGDQYETNTGGDIWEMEGDLVNPLIRVIISPTGSVTLWGSKVSRGPLFPLILTSNTQGQNSFNNVPWSSTGTNTIVVTQNVVGQTLMRGYGYGQNITPCVNYWMGGTTGQENEWRIPSNWTDNKVPAEGQDVEFATVDNYGTAAVDDLHLDDLDQSSSGGRIIGRLINNSNKDLVITTGNQLTINGQVVAKTQQSDGSFGTGTIVVKSTNITTNENEPTGTLIVNKDENPDGVQAIVEFYNQAYDCEECGFYTRSWQYFGIPVKESGTTAEPLPFTSVEEVNEWSEPANGDKWITPNMPLTAFTGYEITRNQTTEPDYDNAVHRFEGLLNIGSVTVGLTRTATVNYPGANLVGNSYTAAIPISGDALTFPAGVEETVYLFNTGTRDQWRKLNGTAINGYRSGQYLAVPVDLGGQDDFPDRIPSMHAFMVLAQSGSGGNLGIDYSKLVKNTTVNRGNGEQIVTRSANNKGTTTAKSTIPSLVMDVIGEQSADRVWIFTKAGTTRGFDNGWDGRKMSETGIIQLYVADDADKEHFQVATVPGLDDLSLGFTADTDGKYTIEFALSDHWTTEEIYLNDLATGTQTRVKNGGSYTFEAKKGDSGTRFSVSSSGDIPADDEAAKITVTATDDSKIAINNKSDNNCSVFISNTAGKILQRLEVGAGNEQVVEDISSGTYVVRLQNAVVNDARKVVVR